MRKPDVFSEIDRKQLSLKLLKRGLYLYDLSDEGELSPEQQGVIRNAGEECIDAAMLLWGDDDPSLLDALDWSES